ncbi:MAG: DNA polymerase III subunit delta [Bacillus subtilis]|nr:DNA polymerase III subunit delta [Bacillus subtilis]
MNGNVYLFYGPERLPLQTKSEELLAARGIEAFDVETFDMEETAVDEAVTAAMTIPFLSERKAVVLRNAYFLAAGAKPAKEPDHHPERLTEYLANPNPTTLLIVQVTTDKLDTRKALCRAFAERASVAECLPVKKDDAYGVARRAIEAAGHTIDADAIEEFVIRTKESEGTAQNELDKLLLFTMGKPVIDAKMVRAVVTKNVEDNVFDLVNAYLAKDAWIGHHDPAGPVQGGRRPRRHLDPPGRQVSGNPVHQGTASDGRAVRRRDEILRRFEGPDLLHHEERQRADGRLYAQPFEPSRGSRLRHEERHPRQEGRS